MSQDIDVLAVQQVFKRFVSQPGDVLKRMKPTVSSFLKHLTVHLLTSWTA